jgi:polar amino acid transport system permease protein
MHQFGISDIEHLLRMALVTILLTVIAFVCGGIVGLVIALCRTSRIRALRWLTFGYIQILQATPLLLLLFCIYFGMPLLGYEFPAIVVVSMGLTLYASSFLGEVWRGAIQSVPKQQWEAGESLALTLTQQRIHIIFPQALRAAIPPTVGFLVQILKNTSVVSVIGFVELMRAASFLNNATFQPLRVFGTVALIYFCMCFPLAVLGRRLEKRLYANNRSKVSLEKVQLPAGIGGGFAGG